MVGLAISSSEPTVKFVCSYGGMILPRFPDGKLRYHGGVTRVIAVDRSVTFSELLIKMGEMCGNSVTLKCQFPKEDLDALVSITSDEDLANIIEEYDRISLPKIRAFIWPIKPQKRILNPLPPSSTISHFASHPLSRCTPSGLMIAAAAANRCVNRATRPPVYPIMKPNVKIPYYACHATRNPSQMYIVDTGN